MFPKRALIAFVVGVLFWTAPAHARRAVFVWDGGGADNNWSTPQNWVGDIAPSIGGGDDLQFPTNAARPVNNNDFVGATFQSIWVRLMGPGCGSTMLNGNVVTVTSALTVECANSFNLPLNVTGVLSLQGMMTLNAPITGSGTLLVAFGGTTVQFGAVNTLSGLTRILPGLIVARLLPGSVIGSVDVVGALHGVGTAGATTVQGIILPGGTDFSLTPAIGTLRTGSLTFTPGGIYRVTLAGAASPTPGAFDQIMVTGTVTLDGTLALDPLDSAAASGAQYVILANDGSDPIIGRFSGLPEGALIPNSAGPFRISYVGGDGNDVTLTAVSAVPAVFVWDGGGADNNWSTAANWVGDVAPSIGGADALEFPGTAPRQINTNDFVGATFQSINTPLSGFCGNNALNGNALTITSAIQGACNVVINAPITLPNATAISGPLVQLNGAIGGGGSIIKTGNGNLRVAGVNTLTGLTTVTDGGLNLAGGAVLGGVRIDGAAASLFGTGTAGPAVIAAGFVAPGDFQFDVGVLHTGSLTIGVGGRYQATVNGTSGPTPGAFDQIAVTGSVTLAGNLAIDIMASGPLPGVQHVIILNDGVDPVVGTFAGLPEGTIFTPPQTPSVFRITYHGGDGNDVVLTAVTSVPALPSLLWSFLAATLLALAVLRLRRSRLT